MKRLLLIMVCMSSLWLARAVTPSSDEGVIGMSVIKDSGNRLDYVHSRFAVNPITSVHLSRYTGEREILQYLNITSVGKQIVSCLLNYTLGEMDTHILLERMPKGRSKNPQAEDFQAALQNNYVLVVKYDEESRLQSLASDSAIASPKGHWYLYQLQCDKKTYEQLEANVPRPGDDVATKGAKRSGYESISIPLKLVDDGYNIGRELMPYLAKNIKYVSAEEIKSGNIKRQLGQTSTALKVALSPLVILKK